MPKKREFHGWKCSHTIRVTDPTLGALREVSCGRCLPCCIRKEQEWVLRMTLEASSSPWNAFVTLTYSDPNRPFMLAYDHVQQFLKYFRNRYPLERVRFCSRLELGEITQREHGHLIIFSTFPMFQSFGTLQSECWPHGALLIQPLRRQRMRYLAKYVHKNFLTDPRSVTHWSTSRRPGIGVDAIIRLASSFAARCRGVNHPIVLPTALRIGPTLYPIARTLRQHFKTQCETLGLQFTKVDDGRYWHDRPDTVLNVRLRRRTLESVKIIDMITDRRLAEQKQKQRFLNGSSS